MYPDTLCRMCKERQMYLEARQEHFDARDDYYKALMITEAERNALHEVMKEAEGNLERARAAEKRVVGNLKLLEELTKELEVELGMRPKKKWWKFW